MIAQAEAFLHAGDQRRQIEVRSHIADLNWTNPYPTGGNTHAVLLKNCDCTPASGRSALRASVVLDSAAIDYSKCRSLIPRNASRRAWITTFATVLVIRRPFSKP